MAWAAFTVLVFVLGMYVGAGWSARLLREACEDRDRYKQAADRMIAACERLLQKPGVA